MSINKIVFGVSIVILGLIAMGMYNSMISKQENVSGSWSQVENVYQRRADLIPNLVNIVKGYAEFEKSTLTGVIEARAKATAVNIDVNNLTPEKIAQFEKAQGEISSFLSRLLVVKEAYPDLKANQQFADLMTQLEGTENRITVERKRFNETVQDYNKSIKTFPRNMMASLFGFETKAYFHSSAGSDKVPDVKF